MHIDGINAIIMLRGTQSEVVYYQQLGRVLSISGTNNPIVIDMVNNCDNMEGYSFNHSLINTIESNNREANKDNKIINIKFIDLIKDIREVLNTLKMYKKYYYNGEDRDLLALCNENNLSSNYDLIKYRLENGMSLDEILNKMKGETKKNER